MESYRSLWSYCTANNRLCPSPPRWSGLWSLLYRKQQQKQQQETTVLQWTMGEIHQSPLSHEELHKISPKEIQWVFRRHIQWASEQNQLDEIGTYLRSLNETEWVHFGEI